MTVYSPQNPIQEESDWFLAEVSYPSRRSETGIACQTQLIDNRDKDHPLRTVADSTSDIAMKCFLILLGIPFYTASVLAVHALRCFTLLASNLAKGECSEALFSLAQEVWAIVKTPFYGLAIGFCAVVGMAFPLTMRSEIANLECNWSGSTRFYALNRFKEADCDPKLSEYFTDRRSLYTTFLAFCFQPIGELNDPTRVESYTVSVGPAES